MIRNRIQAGFERWGRFVYRRARLALAMTLLLVAALATQLPHLEVEASDEAFLHESDPVRVTHDRFRAQFERDEVIVIALRPDRVFDLEFLEKLRAFHEDLERSVPQLQKITSLVNARYTHGVADELIVEDLLEDWPTSSAQLPVLRDRVLAHPLYRNLYISEDGRVTALLAELDAYSSKGAAAGELSGFEDTHATSESGVRPFLTGDEAFAIVAAVREVVARHHAADFQPFLTGGPVTEATLMTAMQRDIALFVVLSILMIIAFLFALFRRASGVVLPLAVVVLSLLCTLSTMALANVPITLPMQVLPTFLLAVGVCDAVHVLTLFYRGLARGETPEDAIAGSLSHAGLAIAMTSLTTAGGLASFSGAALAPVMHFGIFGPIGVLFAFALTLVLIPAAIALMPLRGADIPVGAASEVIREDAWDRALYRLGTAAVRRPKAVLAVTGVALVFACLGMTQLRFAWNPLAWLPENEPVRIATELIDSQLGGSDSFEMLIDAGVENGLHDPDLLHRIDAFQRFAASFEHDSMRVAKTVSVADVLKEIHQALHENRADAYTIPDDRRLISQEFLLFENAGSDDLEDVVDSRFQLASLSFRLPNHDAMDGVPFLDAILERFTQVLDGAAVVTMTGPMVISARSFYAMIRGMAQSYVIALVVITPLMILMLGSIRGGLVSMIPNITPILLTLGLMGWLSVPIDFSTMMSGAIVLSIAVDDTIHFAHGFQRFYSQSGDAELAVRRTLESTGRAMLITSIVLACGFLIYTFASLENLFNLGVFTAFAIATAFLADVLLAPALMMLLHGNPRSGDAPAARDGS